MKIIAHVPVGPYAPPELLVQMNTTEINRILGVVGYIGREDKVPAVGASFDVDKAWQLMNSLNASADRLKSAATTLRALADLCEERAPVLVPPPMEQAT